MRGEQLTTEDEVKRIEKWSRWFSTINQPSTKNTIKESREMFRTTLDPPFANDILLFPVTILNKIFWENKTAG